MQESHRAADRCIEIDQYYIPACKSFVIKAALSDTDSLSLSLSPSRSGIKLIWTH